jgi:hypothetical protein
MSRSYVGLDLDPTEIRGVEMKIGRRRATVTRVARLVPPPDVLIGGAVVDPGELADLLRRWWSEAGFSSKSVIVGLASPDVRIAVVEEPQMTFEELDTALRADAPAVLGVSDVDHVIDYQVVERIESEDDPLLRVLVVAAPRALVDPLMEATSDAGLRLELLDLTAFALLRALVGPTDVDAGAEGEEALAAVGGGGSVVVVHERGSPRRIAVVGPPGPVAAADGTVEVDGAWVTTTVDAIGLVVDANATPPARLRYAAHPAVAAALTEPLRARLQIPVEVGEPRLDMAAVGLDIGDRSSLTVASGLVLAGRRVAPGAHRLDLRPVVAREPSVGLHMVGAAAVVAVAAIGLGALWVNRQNQSDEVRDDAENAAAEQGQIRAEIAGLDDIDELGAELEQKSDLVRTALEGDVAWSKLLQEIATVQPDDVWLRELTAQSAATGETPGFSVSGRGFELTAPPRWIIRLQALPTVGDIWVPVSERASDEELNRFGEVEFESNGTITDEALSDRVDLYIPPDPRVLGAEDPALLEETVGGGGTGSPTTTTGSTGSTDTTTGQTSTTVDDSGADQ